MENYKKTLTEEMDDLTSTLFEEAHEMVRIEKEARHKDHSYLKEVHTHTACMTQLHAYHHTKC